MRSIAPSTDAAMLGGAFERRFGTMPEVFSAPGRVNLIGEHTDYNQGYVLPIAIYQRTFAAITPREDGVIACYSENVGEQREFSLGSPREKSDKGWFSYIEGMARTLIARGIGISGANLMIASSVPPGSGLSSSAALEMSVGLALSSLSKVRLEPVELALMGQSVEHEYAGVKCGIMDQLISAMGKAGHALLIDCSSLETTHVPIPPLEASIVICDTRVRHSLADSGYNQRRAECDEALRLLKEHLSLESLSDLSIEELSIAEQHLPGVLMQRVRHVVSENARTRGAVDALKNGHLAGLGRMMTGSHISLRDDYQVSCKELDFVVDVGLATKSVLGARMTGGGFGGSAVLLVKRSGVDALQQDLSKAYQEQFGMEPHLHVTEAAEGMRRETEKRDER